MDNKAISKKSLEQIFSEGEISLDKLIQEGGLSLANAFNIIKDFVKKGLIKDGGDGNFSVVKSKKNDIKAELIKLNYTDSNKTEDDEENNSGAESNNEDFVDEEERRINEKRLALERRKMEILRRMQELQEEDDEEEDTTDEEDNEENVEEENEDSDENTSPESLIDEFDNIRNKRDEFLNRVRAYQNANDDLEKSEEVETLENMFDLFGDKTKFIFDENEDSLFDENNEPIFDENIFESAEEEYSDDDIIEIPVQNELGDAVSTCFYLTDTPLEILSKTLFQNDINDVKRLIGNENILELLMKDVNFINEEKSVFFYKCFNGIKPLEWNVPIKEQLEKAVIKVMVEKAPFAFVIKIVII